MAPIEMTGPLAAAVLFLLPGLGLVRLLPALRRLDLPSRLGYAYLLGVAWVGGGLYALSHVLHAPLRLPAIVCVVAVPVLLAAGVAASGRGSAAQIERPRRRPAPVEILAAVVALVAFVGPCFEAVSMPLRDYDGRMTWATEARYMRDEGTVSPRAFAEPGWFVTQAWYPALLPVAQVAVLELTAAGEDEHSFRAMYALFYPAWLLIIFGAGRRWTSALASSLTAIVAALLPWATVLPMYGSQGLAGLAGAICSAYSDLPLACFFGGALLLLLRDGESRSAGVAAGMLLAAATLTKNEGALLALWTMLLAAFLPRAGVARDWLSELRRRRLPMALAAVATVAAYLLLRSWQATIASRFSEYQQMYTLGRLLPAERLPELVLAIGKEMFSLPQWGRLWVACPLIVLAGWRGLRRGPALACGLAALGPPAIGLAAYLVAVEPFFLVSTTWSRLLLEASIPFLVVLALAIDELVLPWSELGVAARSAHLPESGSAAPVEIS